MHAPWPQPVTGWDAPELEEELATVQDLIRRVHELSALFASVGAWRLSRQLQPATAPRAGLARNRR